jgi:selenocysteine-specific elongation factor
MSGFGTVVTGTLSDGHLKLGDEVEILPSGIRGRVRSLQTHKRKEELAVPGSRTAINISGVEAESIRRGEVILLPGQYQPTRRLDARFRLLKDASTSIKHSDEVKFFLGASETLAMLRLLGKEEILPGEEAWIQLELREPVVAVRGDRYILRRPSPGETLGGGVVADHQPRGRHKRFDESILRSLESLAEGTPAEVLLEAALALNAAPIRDIVSHSRLASADAEQALQELLQTRSLVTLEEGTPNIDSDLLASAAQNWNALRDTILQIVESYHKSYPLRRGIPREELKSRLKVSARVFNALALKLNREGLLVERAALLAWPGHEITLDGDQQVKVQTLKRIFEQNPFSPPGLKECQAQVGTEVMNALIDMQEFTLISSEVLFRKGDYYEAVQKIQETLVQKGTITLAEVRDLLNTSRKYAQALLEHLDSTGLTLRDGDFRRLKKR